MLKNRLGRAAAGFCLLAVFGFASGNLGQLSAQLNGLLALVFLFLWCLLELSVKDVTVADARKPALFSSLGLLLASVLLWSAGGDVFRCFAVLLFLLAVDFGLDALSRPSATVRAATLGAGLICLYVAAFKYVPFAWHGVESVSLNATAGLSRLTGVPMLLGATASGIHVLIFFLCLVLGTLAVSDRAARKRAVVVAASALAVNAAYLLAHKSLLVPFLNLFQNPYHLGHSHYQPYFNTVLSTGIFLAAALASLRLAFDPSAVAERSSEPPLKSFRLPLAGGLVALGVFLVTTFPVGGATKGTVLLHDKGLLNWDKPVDGKYGDTSTGMFGALPDFLTATGFEPKKTSEISDAVLKDAQTLVVINLQQTFNAEEHAAIWRFVERGGSLLALGDHTAIGGIREPFNTLCKPVGIEWNFDSAHHLTNWTHAFEVFPHPVTRGLDGDDNEIGISIGASLKIAPTVEPVIVGKYGFSDIGNANASRYAYLGDRAHNPGEHLGDIVLVAAARHGKGKVLAFGDTSSFQNGSFVGAHQFVGNVFHWLATPSPTGFPVKTTCGVGILLIGFLFFGLKPAAAPKLIPYATAAALLGLVGSAGLNALAAKPLRFEGNIAHIDTSHLERVSSTFHKDESYLGVVYNLMRNGYFPVEMKRFSPERLAEGKLFVSLAPTEAYSTSERAALKRFMADGGTVLLCAGYDTVQGARSTLAEFGLGVENVPLGPVAPEENTAGAKFYNAWPLRIDRPEITRVVAASKDTTHPLIVEQRHGAGRLLVVGDGGFLFNENLESLKTYTPSNTAFFKTLLGPRPEGDKTQALNREGGK